jgi:hypothetical protein
VQQEKAVQRIWVEEHLTCPESQKKYFKVLSENITYSKAVGSYANIFTLSTQMENPVTEI